MPSRTFPSRIAVLATLVAAGCGAGAATVLTGPASGQVPGGPTTTTTTTTTTTETTPTTPTETTPTETTPTPTQTTPPPTTTTTTTPPTAELPQRGLVGIDALFDRVSRDVPTFAGMYLDRQRKLLKIRVVGGKRADAARAARILRAALRAHGSLGRLSVVPAKYTFKQLARTYALISRQNPLSADDVQTSDIDERANRLTYGVSSDRGAGLIAGRVRGDGVDPGMVRVATARPIKQQKSLADHHRPVIGGLRISGNGLCTQFPVVRKAGGYNVSGFLTASHCTNPWIGNDPEPAKVTFHQPIQNGTLNSIGGETIDPPYKTDGDGPCEAGRVCRYSDAAFITRNTQTTSLLGRIARPSSQAKIDSWNGSSTYRVVGKLEFPVGGESVAKVGSVTGLTKGTIVDTCMRHNAPGGLQYLCQDVPDYSSAGGDSGSPVFIITNYPTANDVKLVGIHRGSGSMSAIGKYNVQASTEIGLLGVCIPGGPTGTGLGPC